MKGFFLAGYWNQSAGDTNIKPQTTIVCSLLGPSLLMYLTWASAIGQLIELWLVGAVCRCDWPIHCSHWSILCSDWSALFVFLIGQQYVYLLGRLDNKRYYCKYIYGNHTYWLRFISKIMFKTLFYKPIPPAGLFNLEDLVFGFLYGTEFERNLKWGTSLCFVLMRS